MGLLRRLCSHEHRGIRTFVIAKRDETQLRQFVFPPIRYGEFGWAFRRHIAVVCHKRVGWQSFDESAAFHAANGGTPFVPGEGIGESRRKSVRGIPP